MLRVIIGLCLFLNLACAIPGISRKDKRIDCTDLPFATCPIPQFPYPDNVPVNTCVDMTINGNNPYAGYFLPPHHGKKRSLASSNLSSARDNAVSKRGQTASLIKSSILEARDNKICDLIAFNDNINNFRNQIGNTATMTLAAGAQDAFSWAFSVVVYQITIWGSDGHGGFRRLEHTYGADRGAIIFTVPNGPDLPVHFEIEFPKPKIVWLTGALANPVTGSVALFRLFGGFGG